MPTLRRHPWGQLWANAPWDGQARPPEPLRIPNTAATLLDTPPPRGAVPLRRQGFGRMLAAAPWAGANRAVPERLITDGRIDFTGVAAPDDETLPNRLSDHTRNGEHHA